MRSVFDSGLKAFGKTTQNPQSKFNAGLTLLLYHGFTKVEDDWMKY